MSGLRGTPRGFDMRHRQQARLAVVALLSPILVTLGSTHATATTPNWLAEANHLRSFWNVSVPTLTEDTTLSANDLAHDNYLDHNNTCGHTEDMNNPYYTAAGAYGGSHSVVYCAALGPVNDVDGWSTTPLHGEQVLNPQLTVTGFAESSLNGGHAAMDTLTNDGGAAAPAVAATWPNGTDFPFTNFAGAEFDYTGGDAVLDNCGSTYAADEASLGAPIFVDLPGAAHNAVPTSASDYFLKDNNGTSLPVCLFDATSPVAPFMSTAVMLPLNAFKPAQHYTASYKAGGVTGTWSFTVSAMPPDPPTAVHVVSSGNHSVTLAWTAPTNNGGSAITGYHVQQYDGTANPVWVDATDTADSSTATSTTVTGLTNGHGYYFRIASKNAIGTGAYSDFSDGAFPEPGPPKAPTAVTGVAGDGKVTVSWTAPSDNGGSAVTGYNVQYSSNSGGSWTSASSAFHTSTATTQDVTGLANGTAYVFRVAAINSLGTGSYSSASSPVTPNGAASPDASAMSAKVTHATITFGQSDAVGGVLGDVTTVQPVDGATVQLMSRPAGGATWSEATEQVTGATGDASFAVTPQQNMDYQWVYAGNTQHTPTQSNVVSVTVRQLVTAAAKHDKVKKGHHVVIKGQVTPTGTGSVQLQVNKHHKWTDLHGPVALTNGHFTITFSAGKKGKYNYRVQRDATTTTAAGTSPTVHISVT